MKCPHCLTDFHHQPFGVRIGTDKEGEWGIIRNSCPACGRDVYELVCSHGFAHIGNNNYQPTKVLKSYLVRPKAAFRPPPPPEVPQRFAEDYSEACLVLADSPKASAALSRRCLQHLLRETAGVKHSDLFREIQEIIDGGKIPSYIADSIDAVRHIGNFAAHPLKSQSTGEIIPVEPGEAEWNLDVLEFLFDFYFVQPALLQKKRDALNQKLADAGKKPMQ